MYKISYQKQKILIYPSISDFHRVYQFFCSFAQQVIKWVMIKQKDLQFRIRRCKKIKGTVKTRLHDIQVQCKSNSLPNDANTEIKEHTVNAEWIDEQHHHFDLQKQENFTKKNQFVAQQANQCELPVMSTEQEVLNELPKITNPEVRQENTQIKHKTIVEENIAANIAAQQSFKQIEVHLAQSNVPSYLDKKDTQLILGQVEVSPESILQQMQHVYQFSPNLKSSTISLNQSSRMATQTGSYWQNKKLILSQPIKNRAKAIFRVKNLKYCVGMGIALKEIIEKHDFNYKSYENQLSHGLFLITSQGYSWSHAYKTEDDTFRPQFKKMKNDDQIQVTLMNDTIFIVCKQASFSLSVPDNVLQKYTLCFCAYLHEKSDSIGLVSQNPPQRYHNEKEE